MLSPSSGRVFPPRRASSLLAVGLLVVAGVARKIRANQAK
jgi:hypothetical protein